MRENGNVMKGHEIRPLYGEWERVEEWVKKALTREKIADAAIAGATIVLFGVLISSLYNASQSFTIVGF